MSEVMSFDYSTAQWILSIIIGVCLTKVYVCIAHHIRYRQETVFYLPYLLLVVQTFVILIVLWFASPVLYQGIEINKLGFIARIIADSLGVIFTLVALPDERTLNRDNLNLKTYYYGSKRTWIAVGLIWSISANTIGIFFASEEFGNMANIMIGITVMQIFGPY